MPLHRRLPKRGFTNIFRTEYTVLNLHRIAEMGETELTHERLRELGFLKRRNELLKILGTGEISSPVTVYAHRFSKSAQEKIEAAGGKAVLIAA